MKKVERFRQSRIFSGNVVTLDLEHVQLPDGHRMDMEVVHHTGGSAIVAIDAQQRACLIRQYRYVIDAWIWEIPAGKIDPGETADSTARKELQEEIGKQASDWVSLGKMLATPGYCDEITHLYLAQGLCSVDMQHEPGEVIEIHWVSLDEAIAWAADGKINDAKTVVALYRARSFLQR